MEALRQVAEVQEEEVWPPNSPTCNFFCYFVCGESEVWVIEKSRNKTKDLIQKMKEVLGSFNRDRGEGLQELEAQDLGFC